MKTEDCFSIVDLISKNSKANRLKVGALILTENNVILTGYNGTPPGTDNNCEENNRTKLEVIHAEENCIIKAAREGISLKGAKVYLSHSPCLHCSAMLLSVGVKQVQYKINYRDDSGVNYLNANGVPCTQFLV